MHCASMYEKWTPEDQGPVRDPLVHMDKGNHLSSHAMSALNRLATGRADLRLLDVRGASAPLACSICSSRACVCSLSARCWATALVPEAPPQCFGRASTTLQAHNTSIVQLKWTDRDVLRRDLPRLCSAPDIKQSK